MAGKQKKTRDQVRDHELAYLNSLKDSGIGKMLTDADVQAALGRYMKRYDFHAGFAPFSVGISNDHNLGSGAAGIVASIGSMTFRLLDKRHGNAAVAKADAMDQLQSWLKKYHFPAADFTAAYTAAVDQAITVGSGVLSGSQNLQESTAPK